MRKGTHTIKIDTPNYRGMSCCVPYYCKGRRDYSDRDTVCIRLHNEILFFNMGTGDLTFTRNDDDGEWFNNNYEVIRKLTTDETFTINGVA